MPHHSVCLNESAGCVCCSGGSAGLIAHSRSLGLNLLLDLCTASFSFLLHPQTHPFFNKKKGECYKCHQLKMKSLKVTHTNTLSFLQLRVSCSVGKDEETAEGHEDDFKLSLCIIFNVFCSWCSRCSAFLLPFVDCHFLYLSFCHSKFKYWCTV